MTRWILAFDGGCSACRNLVERVQAVAGPQLEVQSLAEQEVRDMRAAVFGKDAPWMPTLLAVDGEHVSAWTGPRLSLRLARLLGPGRSMRVVRSIGATREVQNTSRRMLLTRGTLGAAGAAALAMTGGSSTAFAAVLGGGKKIPLHEAAQQKFGISAADIKLEPMRSNAAAVLHRSAANAEVTALRTQFRKAGLTTAEPLAYQAEIPVQGSYSTRQGALDVTRYPLLRGSSTVGEICWVSGPKGSITVAYAKRGNSTFQMYAYDSKGLREHGLFDNAGQAIEGTGRFTTTPPSVSPDANIGCMSICSLLCGSWWATGLSGCIAGCLATGPGEVLCAPICVLVVGGACLLGCAWICCSCCGQC